MNHSRHWHTLECEHAAATFMHHDPLNSSCFQSNLYVSLSRRLNVELFPSPLTFSSRAVVDVLFLFKFVVSFHVQANYLIYVE